MLVDWLQDYQFEYNKTFFLSLSFSEIKRDSIYIVNIKGREDIGESLCLWLKVTSIRVLNLAKTNRESLWLSNNVLQKVSVSKNSLVFIPNFLNPWNFVDHFLFLGIFFYPFYYRFFLVLPYFSHSFSFFIEFYLAILQIGHQFFSSSLLILSLLHIAYSQLCIINYITIIYCICIVNYILIFVETCPSISCYFLC